MVDLLQFRDRKMTSQMSKEMDKNNDFDNLLTRLKTEGGIKKI